MVILIFATLSIIYFNAVGWLFMWIVGGISITINTFCIVICSITIHLKYNISKKFKIIMGISLLISGIPPIGPWPWGIPQLVFGIIILSTIRKSKTVQ